MSVVVVDISEEIEIKNHKTEIGRMTFGAFKLVIDELV